MRHPSLITTIEEDFKKIGLLSEEDSYTTVGAADLPTSDEGEAGSRKPGHKPMKSGKGSWLVYKTGELRPTKQSADRKDPNIDYMDDAVEPTDDENLDEAANVEAFAEAVKFAEAFDEDFDSIDEESDDADAQCFEVSKLEMRELESLGESITLNWDVLAESDDSDDDDEEDDDMGDDEEDGEDDMDEGSRRMSGSNRMVRTHKASSKVRAMAKKYYRTHKSTIGKRRAKVAKSAHGKRMAKFGEAIANHLDTIEQFVSGADSVDVSVMDEAKVAFANVALIAEALAADFDTLSETTDEYTALVFNLGEMAAQAEAIATRIEEGAGAVDTDKLESTFAGMVENLLTALDTFSELDEDVVSDDSTEESVPKGKD